MQVLIKGEVLVCQLLKGGSINNHILTSKIHIIKLILLLNFLRILPIFWKLLDPLPVGDHEIYFRAKCDDFELAVTYLLTVK